MKQNYKNVLPQLASWMGVSDHPELYESSFCGLQYWGPVSNIGNITGFDTKAIKQPLGRLFGPRDIEILETLFWPLSKLYDYTGLNEPDFWQKFREIRPWLDEPLEFENTLYSKLVSIGNKSNLKDLFPYKTFHSILLQHWEFLERKGTHQGIIQPLELDF